MTRKPPMTKNEAIEIIAIMRKKTPTNAMRKIIEIALGPHGNLSDEARVVYQAVV